MADIFSTDTMIAIVRDLRLPQMGLAAKYFGQVSQDESEEIHFDVDNKPRRMAPFVSPVVGGKVVKSRSWSAKTFKPAYVKDKRVFTPNRAIKRIIGERIGGGDYSPQDRIEMLVAMDLQDQLEMIERRLEWMAAQVLNAGKITISGEEYPEVEVDFGRHADLTKTLSGVARWGETGVKPLDDLQDWSDLMVKHSGVGMTDVAMTIDAWKIFRADAEVKDRLNRLRGTSTMQDAAHQREGMVYQGTVDQFNIYTYSGWVVDPVTGVEGATLPTYTVLGMGGDMVEGVRHFGAIQDHDSLMAEPYFPKSWLEQDPSIRYLLMQSAPLLVPYRANATFRAKVR